MPETLICCQRCDNSSGHDESAVKPPEGWLRFEEGWVCPNHFLDVATLLQEANKICVRLEEGRGTLEQSLVDYEHGVAIQERIKTYLREMDSRVEIIRQDGRVEKFDHETALAKKQAK